LLGSILQPVACGVLALAASHGQTDVLTGLLAVAGFSIGVTLGPLALQVQYSYPAKYTAVLVTLNLFVRLLFLAGPSSPAHI
jgi:hypothetical protein